MRNLSHFSLILFYFNILIEWKVKVGFFFEKESWNKIVHYEPL